MNEKSAQELTAENGQARDVVLIVDDVDTNRMILVEILQDMYDTVCAENGKSAIEKMFSGEALPSIVLLDIMMPEMDGYGVLELMKKSPITRSIPIIFITGAASENESKGLGAGAVDYISKPFDPEIVKARVKTHLRLHHYSDRLERMVEEKTEEMVRAKERMVETMANMIEYRNLESGSHVRRTSELTRVMADYLCKNPKLGRHVAPAEVDIMANATPLHDVGKIAIADAVLLKPGRLTPAEFEIIKTHAPIGGDIIKQMSLGSFDKYLACCEDIATSHHERWDGKGYPNGLSGENIPLAARIVSIVDVYDALISERVYKSAMTHAEAVEIIREGGGTQFDPVLVEAFLQIEETIATFAAMH